jgi:hypothetical protein
MRAIGIDPSTGPKTPEPPEAEERDRQHISAGDLADRPRSTARRGGGSQRKSSKRCTAVNS